MFQNAEREQPKKIEKRALTLVGLSPLATVVVDSVQLIGRGPIVWWFFRLCGCLRDALRVSRVLVLEGLSGEDA